MSPALAKEAGRDRTRKVTPTHGGPHSRPSTRTDRANDSFGFGDLFAELDSGGGNSCSSSNNPKAPGPSDLELPPPPPRTTHREQTTPNLASGGQDSTRPLATARPKEQLGRERGAVATEGHGHCGAKTRRASSFEQCPNTSKRGSRGGGCCVPRNTQLKRRVSSKAPGSSRSNNSGAENSATSDTAGSGGNVSHSSSRSRKKLGRERTATSVPKRRRCVIPLALRRQARACKTERPRLAVGKPGDTGTQVACKWEELLQQDSENYPLCVLIRRSCTLEGF